MEKKSLNILLASDFFFPKIGGVEAHIYSLAYCFASYGHKVVIITHDVKQLGISGVKYISPNIKVYYVPGGMAGPEVVKPMFFSTFTLLIRNIIQREQIDIIHGHQRTSMIVIALTIISRLMRIPIVVTQHSLFDFNDLPNVEINKLFRVLNQIVMKNICVSNTVRENITLASHMPGDDSCVFPTAIDSTFYSNRLVPKDPSLIKIVVFSRMTFRKGVDLLLEIICYVCGRYPQVRFLISGDGPKSSLLENLIRDYHLQDQVSVQGFTEFEKVPFFLSQGDIFLNTSVTEAFCLAILEAAACGLFVVSTAVGGIPEILPADSMILCKAESEDMIRSLCHVIDNKLYLKNTKNPAFIKESYDWFVVAKSTLQVYYHSIENYQTMSLVNIAKLGFNGYMGGIFVSLFLVFMMYVAILFSDFVYPRARVRLAKPFKKN